MKKHSILIGNLVIILIGLIALQTPYLTDAINALNIAGYLDPSLLQLVFIVFLIFAMYGQFMRLRLNLKFFPFILQFVLGLVAFLFVFPLRNSIVGYLSLFAIFLLLLWPKLEKQLRKKKIVKIKV